MASLLDNWLQPLIDNHLPNLWRFAQDIPSDDINSSQIAGSLQYSSPGSQAKYKIQQLILPKQNILQLRVRFTDDAAECLQLLTYFNRDHGIRCKLSDGFAALNARVSLSAVHKLLKEEGLSLTNLTVGTILQVPVINIRFIVKTRQGVIDSIKTELDIHHFRVVDRSSSIYGHPKLIGNSAAYHNIIGDKFQPTVFGRVQMRSHLPSLSTSESPSCGASQKSVSPDSDTSPELAPQLQRDPSQDFVLNQAQNDTGDSKPHRRLLQDQDEPLPSIEMPTRGDTHVFSAASLIDWKDVCDVPRCITLVSEDQEDLLNGNAHMDERGDRHPTWLPPNGREYVSAPLPMRLKQEIVAQILADQKANSKAEGSSTPRRTSLKAISQGSNRKSPSSNTQHTCTKRSDPDSDKENDSDDHTQGMNHNEQRTEHCDAEAYDDDRPISDWEITPPRPPIVKIRDELPPDTPEPVSSMPVPSSPVQYGPRLTSEIASTDIPHDKKIEPRPEVSSSVRSRVQSEAAVPQRLSHGRPVPRFNTISCRATPRPEHAQPSVQKLSLLGSMMQRPGATHVPSSYSAATSRNATPSNTINSSGKRPASESLTPRTQKKRNLSIAFGFSQDTPVSHNPRALISQAKREVINAQQKSRVSGTAEPTSSRVPETQFTQSRAIAQRKPEPVLIKPPQIVAARREIQGNNLQRSSNNHDSYHSNVKTASVVKPGGDEQNAADPFQIFRSAYPQYTGDRNHFTKLCKQLFAVRNTFAKILWDDFVVRHKAEYVPYATECINDGEQAKSYVEFCSEYDVSYNKKILTPDLLRIAASPAT